MNILQLNHVSINVKNLDSSLSFYEKVLGLKYLGVVDMGDHRLYYFRLNEFTRLELIDYDHDLNSNPNRSDSLGIYRHIAIEVDEIEKWESRIESAGIRIWSRASTVARLSAKTMLIEDPNGVEIEFLENVGSP